MAKKQFVHYEHKGADYILENPNTDLDFIEMLGDCLDEKEIVNRLNELYEENKKLEKENEQLKIHMKSAKAHLESGYTKKAIERLKIIDIR